MNELTTSSIFETIKHIDEKGNEYWYARELQKVLDYSLWQNFHKVIKQAREACNKSNYNINDHFIDLNKMVNIGSNTKRSLVDYKLSRYACYLIAQNGDSKKEAINKTHKEW